MIKNLQAKIRPSLYKKPFSLKFEIGSYLWKLPNQVIEPVQTDNTICEYYTELYKCFESSSLDYIKVLILPQTSVVNEAS